MTSLGPGVSRVLDPTATAFLEVIFQQGKPPMDSEFNLSQELPTNLMRMAVLSGTPSGWISNETDLSTDFVTSPLYSNWFKFGQQRSGELSSPKWANVNGWLVPVMGTRTGSPPGSPNDVDTFNTIVLDSPPVNSGDFRIDFVFLEVWLARVAPNPSTTNKPSSSGIFRHGNVEGGFTYISDDLIDPSLGFETAQRVQLQYRIRVVKGLVGFTNYPDGFDPAIVKAKGAYDPTNPDTATAYVFTNMRQTLGDPGLWRAGDGTQNNLGSVDGYVYAIPIAAVFRRNGVTWNGDPSQNLNGSFNRNPTAITRVWTPTTFVASATTSAAMTNVSTSVTLASVANLPLPTTPATPVLIQIGDEIMTYQSITGSTLNNLVRGPAVAGTVAEAHPSGSAVRVLSGRPDGLFADQVASTDILDLRHVVNPNGFNYQTLLESNLDKLLKGELRANWKRSGAGPQGPFLAYQDKITAGAVALGVTKLDAPDRIRTIFSDAISVQPVEIVVKANASATPTAINVPWSLNLSAIHVTKALNNFFSPGDVIKIPVNQLKAGLPGGDADQVRWLVEGLEIHIDGDTAPVNPSTYVVTPASPTSSDDLLITLQANFPTTGHQLYIKVNALYGAGRGLSRRPDAIHSLALLSPSTDILRTPAGVPSTNFAMKVAWVPLWNKFQTAPFLRSLPTMAEAYADPGSKTIVLQPLQRLEMPTEFLTVDGSSANLDTTGLFFTGVAGQISGLLSFTDLTVDFVAAGVTLNMALVVLDGPQPGRYNIVSVGVTTLVLDRSIGSIASPTVGISYEIWVAQGLMPLLKKDGVTPKWTMTDPLDLFSGQGEANANTKNIYVSMPRHMVPTWGEYRYPILRNDTAVFAEGINYMLLSVKGIAFANSDRNYVPYSASGSLSYAVFSTLDLTPPGTFPATYNAPFTFGGKTYAGVRKYTDTRGLGRAGLELPPFYGIVRLFGVYEANDYKLNNSPFDPSSRGAGTGTAKNLLRQNFDGPLFWVEIDDDGDSTFILNADAIDLTKSTTNPIASFATGNFVIESSIFGFDRGSFDAAEEFRLVMTRPTGSAGMRQEANDLVVRGNNIHTTVAGPVAILPAPLAAGDSALINFSRTPYGGDAWGSQTNYVDFGYVPGSLTSGVANLISSAPLDETALTRPNQKVLEVLASTSFMTTAGTGRISGDADASGTQLNPLRNPGYENVSAYPPTNPIAARPNFTVGALTGEKFELPVTSKYLGCVERLPLGSLWRDKDFRGASLASIPGPMVKGLTRSLGGGGSLARASTLEATNIIPIPDHGTGEPGILVHVDGEQGNYALLTNYRTLRGGSVFSASNPNPGGEVLDTSGKIEPYNNNTIALCGTAYLVRNAPTSIGATEVSAGDELMMLVVTTVRNDVFGSTVAQAGHVFCSTNGYREGYSAADLYRIEGHPLVRDNVRVNLDPSTITLTPNLEG
jgi:hypothetical protein